MSHRSPRIAFVDLETAPTRGWVWQNWDADLIRTDKDWYILSFAVKWSDEKKIRTYALPDYPGYKKNKECDRALVKELHRVFDEADIIVAHNIAFDVKKANARFAIHNLKPPSPYKTICTLKIARAQFKFGSNKLTDLGTYLGIGGKLPHTGAHLWFSAMSGDELAWDTMRRYNARDVELLFKVFERIKPFAPNLPNLNIYTGADGCPTCQSGHVQRRGVMVKLNSKRHRFHCQDCGAWFASQEKAA
jgi:hypothetical protein